MGRQEGAHGVSAVDEGAGGAQHEPLSDAGVGVEGAVGETAVAPPREPAARRGRGEGVAVVRCSGRRCAARQQRQQRHLWAQVAPTLSRMLLVLYWVVRNSLLWGYLVWRYR